MKKIITLLAAISIIFLFLFYNYSENRNDILNYRIEDIQKKVTNISFEVSDIKKLVKN